MGKKIIDHCEDFSKNQKNIFNSLLTQIFIENDEKLKEFQKEIGKVVDDFHNSLSGFFKRNKKFLHEHVFYYYCFCIQFHQYMTKNVSIDIAYMITIYDYYFAENGFVPLALPIFTASEELAKKANKILNNEGN